MRKTKIGLSAACLTAVAMSASALAQTEVIYNNTENYLGLRTSPQNSEIGDIVNLTAGSGRILTEFAFEYFASDNLSGNEFGQIFIRSVDENLIPGAILFQSSPFTLESGFNARFENTLGTVLPTDRVAWTVVFAGFEGTEEAGLLYYNPPTVGSSPTFEGQDFMIQRNADGTFAFVDVPGVSDNLSARFTAVPEPTTWALILGGLAGFGLLRRRKA